MELVELVRGAQDAMDRGDYRLATTASAHGLAAFPSCLAAHRILGEAHLELGNTDPATKHFERTLAVDPLNVVARLGLGVASEEQEDYGSAYAHYLHAWEINPALDQVRDELVRLRGLLGVEDRLHPTRAGLAGIHARGGQLHRAANEWRAVLAVEPESRRARTSFAELLWRQGEDGLAAVASRDALRGSPENARALAILADTERRRGGANTEEFAERYRAVDPTGDVLKLLSEWRSDVDLGFLETRSALVDDFDFSAYALPADQLGSPTKIATNALAGNQIAAPDLWDTLVKDLSSELPATGVAPTVASGVEPFSWNDAGPDQSEVGQFDDLGVEPFDVHDLGGGSDPAYFSFAAPADEPVSDVSTADVSTADIYTAALSKGSSAPAQPEPFAHASSVDQDDELSAFFAPATDREIADATPPAVPGSPTSADLWGGSGDGAHAVSTVPDGFDDLTDLADLGIEPFSFDGMPALLPDVDDPSSFAPRREQTPAARAGHRDDELPELHVAAAARPEPELAAVPVAPVFVDPFVGADGKIDLTAGWDDLDRSLAAATPSFEPAGHYDDLSAEIDLDGITPFDADIPGEDEDAWAPLTEDDFGIPPVSTADVLPAPTAGAPIVASSDHVVPSNGDWSLGDIAVELGHPTALDALMALPTVDGPAARTSTTLDEPAELIPASDASDGESLIGSELSAIPVTFDDEVIFGIPAQQSSGYTELLRHVDVEELEGRDPADGEINPFSSPDSNGDPLAFEDLLAVTSRDGTAPLVSRGADAADSGSSPFDFADTDSSTAEPAEVDRLIAMEMADLGIGGLDAFDLAAVTDGEGTAMGCAEMKPAWSDAEVGLTDDPSAGMTTGIYTGILDDDELAGPPTYGALEPFSFDVPGADDVAMDAGDPAGIAVSDGELSPFDFDAALSESVAAHVAEAEPMGGSQLDVEPLATVPATEPEASSERATPDWSGAGGLGMAIGSVVWPAFVNQTSDLIDRDLGTGSIFARLRAGKSAAVASGQLVVDRRLVVPAVALATAPVGPPVEPLAEVEQSGVPTPPAEMVERRRQRPEMSEQTRLDLMAMRVRLIEDADSYEEVAASVERAVGEGLADPLALRILGEAYLKLGRMEQAAAQFRQAMLARQRTR